MKEEERYGMNLKKYKKHQRSFPWALVRKIVIAIALIGLAIYLNNVLKEKENTAPDDQEIEIELT